MAKRTGRASDERGTDTRIDETAIQARYGHARARDLYEISGTNQSRFHRFGRRDAMRAKRRIEPTSNLKPLEEATTPRSEGPASQRSRIREPRSDSYTRSRRKLRGLSTRARRCFADPFDLHPRCAASIDGDRSTTAASPEADEPGRISGRGRIGPEKRGEIPKWLNGADCKSAGLWPTEVRILLSPPLRIR